MKNVIITGASRGLGLEITEHLLTEGYKVFAISRTSSKRLEVNQSKFGKRLQLLEFDLKKTESIKKDIFENQIGFATPIYGLVNNAATAYDDLLTNSKPAMIKTMFEVGVFANMEITKHAIRNMLLHQTAGSIVHISSVCVHTGYKGLSMYAASKGAIEAFSKNAAREWGSKKIRSNCIVSGFLETDMTSSLNESQRKKVFSRTALHEPTSKLSVAATVEFLLSEKSNSITGQNLFVDSGTI